MKTRVLLLGWTLTMAVAGAMPDVGVPCVPCATDRESSATGNQTIGGDAKTASPTKPAAPVRKQERKDRQSPPARPNYMLM